MITIKLSGRLGNQMFQYCICRIIAQKNGYNFYIPKKENDHGQNILNYFNLDAGKIDTNIFLRLFYRFTRTYKEDHRTQKYNPDIFNIKDNTYIWGFYQTDKYFKGYEDTIKKWFFPKKTAEIDTILTRYPVAEYCYIHFRGTDYKDHQNWYLPISYYKNAIALIRKKYPYLKFLIITDDIETAGSMFTDIEIVSNDIMVDFSLLYNSIYCIIPNSTFSWWAAWLSKKQITVAPNRWCNYNASKGEFSPLDIKTDTFTYIE